MRPKPFGLFPPPRFGEGVRGWGLALPRPKTSHPRPPSPKLRGGTKTTAVFLALPDLTPGPLSEAERGRRPRTAVHFFSPFTRTASHSPRKTSVPSARNIFQVPASLPSLSR